MPNFLDSLFGKPEQPAQQQQQQPAPNPNTPAAMDGQQQQQMQGVAPTGQPPAQPDPQSAPQPQTTDDDPLALYASLFDNKGQEGDENLPPQFALSPETLTKAMDQMDFTQGLDQDTLAKLTEGDLSVLPSLMNHVAKQAYSQALSHGTALTGQYVGQYGEYQAKQVAPMVREELTNSALFDGSQATGEVQLDLSNPKVKEQVMRTAKELQAKNPTMPPAQVAELAKQYHVDLVATMLGANGQALASLRQQYNQQQQAAPKETDWDDYLK